MVPRSFDILADPFAALVGDHTCEMALFMRGRNHTHLELLTGSSRHANRLPCHTPQKSILHGPGTCNVMQDTRMTCNYSSVALASLSMSDSSAGCRGHYLQGAAGHDIQPGQGQWLSCCVPRD